MKRNIVIEKMIIGLFLYVMPLYIFSQETYEDFHIGEIFPFSEIQTTDGKVYSIEELNSRLLVMNFWSSKCKGMLQRPQLNALHDLFYQDSIAFWSITDVKNYDPSEEPERYEIDWDVIGNVEVRGGAKQGELGLNCLPTTIVINSDREILYSRCTLLTYGQNFEKFVQLLRKESNTKE